MAGLKFAFLLGLMALLTLMEQTKPVAGGRRGRLKKLSARLDDLEARLGTIEECKSCEKPQPKPVTGRRAKQLRIRVKNLEARLDAFEKCISCETPQPKPLTHRRLKRLKVRVDNLEARLKAIEACKPCEKPPYSFLFPKKGTSDYIEDGTFNKALTAITACLWVKTAEGTGSFISYATRQYHNEFLVYIANNGQIRVIAHNRGYGSTVTINDNEWHHVCVTLGDNAFKVYVDGARRYLNQVSQFTIDAGGKVIIGQDQDRLGGGFTTADSFKGEMTGINVWDHVLSDAAISELAESCSAGKGNIKSMADLADEDKLRGDAEMISSDCEPPSNEIHIKFRVVSNRGDGIAI